jgi:hypothetical protein
MRLAFTSVKIRRAGREINLTSRAHLMGTILVVLSAIVAPHASAAGICMTAGSSLYGSVSLASTPVIACGNLTGYQSNLNSGATGSFSPNSLPTPISQLNAGIVTYQDPSGQTAKAIASLGAGTLGDVAHSGPSVSDLATSILLDGVHFTITDGAPFVPISINLDLGGTLSGSGSYSNAFSFSFGGQFAYNMQNGAFSVGQEQGWVGTPTLTNESVTGFHFSGVLDVTNGETLPLIMSLALSCSSGEICDLSHTAALSFVLPSDVTFTSDSGVLLTQTGSGVPEPAPMLLIAAGLAGIALAGRLRRREERITAL